MQQAETIVLLLGLVAALVVIAQKITLPYPVVLVLAGLALSFVPRLPEVKLNPDIVFYFFLPPLIYPAALFTSWRDFRKNLRPILLLAIGLVLTTMMGVAWVAHSLIPSIPWAAAFALGAIVSPPDAVAATSVIRRLPVPHQIRVVLEGESLVNDATALVALQFAVVALMTGTFSLGQATARFVIIAIGLQLPRILRELRGESFGALIDDALLVSGAAVLIRIGWVFVATYLPRSLSKRVRKRDPYPGWRNVAVVAWAGMRGVIC